MHVRTYLTTFLSYYLCPKGLCLPVSNNDSEELSIRTNNNAEQKGGEVNSSCTVIIEKSLAKDDNKY